MFIEVKSVTTMLNQNTKEVAKITQILQVKSIIKITNKFLNKFLIATGDNDVIHIH